MPPEKILTNRLTPDQIEQMQDRHRQVRSGYVDPDAICETCSDDLGEYPCRLVPWPCDAALLLAELDARADDRPERTPIGTCRYCGLTVYDGDLPPIPIDAAPDPVLIIQHARCAEGRDDRPTA